VDPRLLALALTWLGCGSAPDFVTPLEVAFHLNGADGPSLEQASAQERRLHERLQQASLAWGEESLGCWARAEVHLVPSGPFPCAGRAELRCAGEQYGPHLKVAAAEAPSASAWRHELLHWLQECAAGSADEAHQGGVWELVED
jgi:hypothetical protein